MDKQEVFGDFIKENLQYSEFIGDIIWKKDQERRKAGQSPEGLDSNGYNRMTLGTDFEGKKVKAFFRSHRVAWFLKTGQWPLDQIDHKNGIKDDNRWSNLRAANNAQNQANGKLPKSNTSGFKGVYHRFGATKNPYEASVRVNGKLIHLGSFPTPERAHAAYVEAAEKYFGEFAHAG